MFNFLSGMWVLRKIDEAYLRIQISKLRLSQQEYEIIISTPQI